MNEFLLCVEKHKDLVDLGLKVLGYVGTVIVAAILAAKYFAEKRAARKTKEQELRRDAYFSYFASIPLQIAAVAAFFKPKRDPLVLPPEAQVALHKLHLLANRDALKLIIDRNALFHKAVMDLAVIKAQALNHQDFRNLLINDLIACGPAMAGPAGSKRDEAVQRQQETKEQLQQLEPFRIGAWENFIEQYHKLVADLNQNYLILLPLARTEIGLDGNIDETVARMEADRVDALATFQAKMPAIRKGFDLDAPPIV